MALLLAIALLAGNAFFVGAEFAVISARRSGIEPLADAGSRRARVTLQAMEQVSRMLATAQLGITVCSLGLGAVGEPAVAHLLEPPLELVGISGALLHGIAFTVALSLVVFLHVVLGEMVPKNIALAGPERSALLLAPPLVFVTRVLSPIISVLNGMANGVLRLLRIEPKEEVASAFTRDEIAAMVEEARVEGLLADGSGRLVTGALTFEEHTAADVLVPRAELVTLEPGATPTDVERACAQTGFSRFVTVDEHGAPTGYLHVKDVLELTGAAADQPVPGGRVRPLAGVALAQPIAEVLEQMQKRGAHMAAVHDRPVHDQPISTGEPEPGEVVGVVMLEDVIETLVGDIRDAMTGEDAATPR
ncbi:MAG: HlyC/CorC family transporter [Geodermatophilaceae bacterium]|nr:HlyC/CorC family transporter [Geodermatophilaceae bacterium]